MQDARQVWPNRCSGESAYLAAQRLSAEVFEDLEEGRELQDLLQASVAA